MNALILAAEATTHAPPGDDFTVAAYILLGVAMLVAAVATVIVTPSGEHH